MIYENCYRDDIIKLIEQYKKQNIQLKKLDEEKKITKSAQKTASKAITQLLKLNKKDFKSTNRLKVIKRRLIDLHTLEAVGKDFNCTREKIRLLEAEGYGRLNLVN